MQPLFAVYGAVAKGESRITDLRFPGRYGYAAELEKMGLDFELSEGMLVIHGGRQLRGAQVTALDLRAGVALALAGLTADGTTRVIEAWQIDRGYDRFLEKLCALGARVSRMEYPTVEAS